MSVWEIDGSRIRIGDETVEVEGEITADKIKEVARAKGIKRFTVEDPDGNTLTTSDFPRTGEVIIKEYNEAK